MVCIRICAKLRVISSPFGNKSHETNHMRQGFLSLNQSGKCLKSIFSVRAFDLIPRLRARPKYQVPEYLINRIKKTLVLP